MTTKAGGLPGVACTGKGLGRFRPSSACAKPRATLAPACRRPLTGPHPLPIVRAAMKIRNSLKSAKVRDKDCRVVRRRGRVYVINKKNPRMKSRQG